MRSLNLENVIKAYGLESYEQTIFLVLEDFGGTPNRPVGSPTATSFFYFSHWIFRRSGV
jgi:hypothetical protein